MKKVISILAMVAIAGTVFAQAQRVYNAENLSPVFRVKNGGTDKVIISVHGAGSNILSVVIGSSSNRFAAAAAYDTVAELAAGVRAATNDSEKAILDVDYDCSIGTESTSNHMRVGTITIGAQDHKWQDACYWATITNKAFITYIPGKNVGGSGNGGKVTKIDGNIGGTGNVEVLVYRNGTEVYNKLITSPIYPYWPSSVTATNQYGYPIGTRDDIVNLDLDVNIPFGGADNIQIRATRATDATMSGGIGANFEYK